MSEWWITATAHVVLVAVYTWLAFLILRGLVRARQWRSNPLAVASAAIFASCALGHGVHLVHALEWLAGADGAVQRASIIQMSEPFMLAWSVATALVAGSYVLLRRRLGLVTQGGPICDDLKARGERARALRRPIVMAIEDAQRRLHRGDVDGARHAVQIALWQGRQSITVLIDGQEADVRPGALRRSA